MTPRSMPAHPDRETGLSRRGILRFYRPLVLTSQLVTLSGPLLNIALGRAADPKLDLAAFWIAFTVVSFLEAPCLVVQQTALAVAPRGSLRRLVAGALGAGAAASLLVLALGRTALGEGVFPGLIPTTARVADLARSVLIALAPLPLLIAIRGLGSAVAVGAHRTDLVGAATAVRLVVIAGGVGAAVATRHGVGVPAACATLVVGVALETAFIVIATWPRWRGRLGAQADGASDWSEIARVAGPLAVSTMMWTFLRPAIHSILGRLPDPELAQASFGVIQPIVLVACSPSWALQDVSLVLTRRRADLERVLRFAAGVAALFTAIVGLVVLTPLKVLVLRLGFDLSPELENAVAPALALLAIEPTVLAARAVAQGLLTRARRTGVFLILSPAKIVLTLVVGLAVVTARPNVAGAWLALGLVIGGDLFDALLYGLKVRRVIADEEMFRDSAPGPDAVEIATGPAPRSVPAGDA